MSKQIRPEVFNGYRDEVRGYLPAVRTALGMFRRDTDSRTELAEARRQVHIIKGASAMTGMEPLSCTAQELETILEALESDAVVLTDELAGLLERSLDLIKDCIDSADTPETAACDGFDELLGALRAVTGSIPPPPQMRAAAPPSAGTGVQQHKAIPRELLEVFKLEAQDHFSAIRQQLEGLRSDPGSSELVQDLRRTVHTLKGSAGAVGFTGLAGLAHRMEDLLDALYDATIPMTAEVVRLIADAADILEDTAENRAELAARADVYARLGAMLDSAAPADSDLSVERRSGITDRRGVPREPSEGAAADDLVRVSQDRIDGLIKAVGELVINRSTLQQHLGSLEGRMHALDPVVERLRTVSSRLETEYELAGMSRGGPVLTPGAAGRHDFDELELDRYTEFHHLLRQLSEAATDLKTCRHEIETVMNECSAASAQQGRLSSDIQEKLMDVRMVPLSSIANRLRQIVRAVSQSQGKLVDLVIEGEHIEIDKKVLDEMVDPLMHVIRNDIDHGIETPEERRALGKHERGLIRVRAYHEGSRIVIAVSDDGAGLQLERIRAAALARGLICEEESRTMSEDELYQLIFHSHFSTAEHISEVSGRGVGMDVVKRQVNRLQGTLLLESSPGRGTLLTIRLPMSLSIRRALLVEVWGERYAVPLSSLKRIVRIPVDQLPAPDGPQEIVHGNERYSCVHLGRFMGCRPQAQQDTDTVALLIVDVGNRFAALQVDEILGEREVVVKNIGTLLQRVRGISGATVLGDGKVLLIINPLDIGMPGDARQPTPTAQVQVRTLREHEQLTVMIVDDSISVRQVVSNLIESCGWRALGASDGFAALELLQRHEKRPDIILLDVEMPRMDGYELLARLKSRDLWRRIPVVMLTSRSGEKHRLRALELGAAEYIVKPYNDDNMRATIRHLVNQSRGD